MQNTPPAPTSSAPAPAPAGRRGHRPWLTLTAAAVMVAVAGVTLDGTVRGYVPADGLVWQALAWPWAHADWEHLSVNLTVLLLAGPQLEAGSVPVVGASASVYALVAYNLVVGWDRPFESRTGRALAWPRHLLAALIIFETLRFLVSVSAGSGPSGAPAHLGGLAAGVVACGLLERRWPSRPEA